MCFTFDLQCNILLGGPYLLSPPYPPPSLSLSPSQVIKLDSKVVRNTRFLFRTKAFLKLENTRLFVCESAEGIF